MLNGNVDVIVHRNGNVDVIVHLNVNFDLTVYLNGNVDVIVYLNGNFHVIVHPTPGCAQRVGDAWHPRVCSANGGRRGGVVVVVRW